jgi:NDP-sugar pyrophosphorylase family protein
VDASRLSSVRNLVTALVNAGDKLAGLEIAGRWVDVRDPEVLAELENEEAKR